jgi:hypothetical protein
MIQGGLFTREFLLEGVTEETAWSALDDDYVETAKAEIERLLRPLATQRSPNEAETELQLIFPLLAAIGWDHVLPQQNMSVGGRQDVPDALLFADQASLEKAQPEAPWKRFQHGVCVLESKRWARPLDRPPEGREKRTGEDGVPSTQMLRYMRRADDVTQGRLRWGVLTNGRLWRLYWQGAVYESENYIEIDLGKVFALPGCDPDLLDPRDLTADHAFRLFLLIFGKDAFVAVEQGRTFHDIALETGKRWEKRVAADLSRVVFETVFPILTAALGQHDRGRPAEPDAAWLEEVRQGALILLYRLLFVLYAEDRNLLPDESGPYSEYALTRIRQDVAAAKAQGRVPSARATIYWSRLRTIFIAIADGDDGLGIPPYNGGLFDPATAPILSRVDLPDAVIAEVVFGLSHIDGPTGPKYVNYRDLSVQQLGSIYERILEFGLRVEGERVVVDADADERHDSGSFYTPEALVSLIIDKAVSPLVEARLATFAAEAERLAGDQRPVAARLEDLAMVDPASSLLDLKICDPAMGSGHFLVSLVEWLAVRVLEATAEAAAQVTWGDYVSPLTARIGIVRARILEQAQARAWPIVREQLDDPKIVRRMILKRVVHGVDKNPMAVELAKVALWLHTFTVGAPLSFLDHHLRCGDSVVGAWVRPTLDAVEAAGGLLARSEIARIEGIAGAMTSIEQTTDNDVAEVAASKATFGAVEDATRDLDAFFSFMTARPTLNVDLSPKLKGPRYTPEQLRALGKSSERQIATAEKQQAAYDRAAAFRSVLEEQYGDPLKIASGEVMINTPDEDEHQPLLGTVDEGVRRRRSAAAMVAEARRLTAKESFLHWQIAFPNVWRRLDQRVPDGGFDAVIGNPPYVRQEKLTAVKPALQASYDVFAGTADLYIYFFEQGLKLVKPGGRVAYVVNNKWLKAGYAEALRTLLTDPSRAETEVLIDFGHARGFFPDADVFPNVTVVRKPDGTTVPETLTVAIPSRETLPDENLAASVEAASFPLARAVLSPAGWTLEPKPVMDLLAKIRNAGVPLTDHAGMRPLYGVKTGFNEAFLIDTATRNKLVADDPRCAEIIKPYLRGQDIDRWSGDWRGLHMIFARKGIEISEYPSVLKHLTGYREKLEPKPSNWKPAKPDQEWPGRKAGSYAWYELQDPVEYWPEFSKPKLLIRRIEFYADVAYDDIGRMVNDSAVILPTQDMSIIAALNSPALWYLRFRTFPHKKDEALAMDIPFISELPIPTFDAKTRVDLDLTVGKLRKEAEERRASTTTIHDWLRLELGIEQFGRDLATPARLDADDFVRAVKAALPRRRGLSAAEIARLKHEHADTLEPARLAAAEAVTLERRLSDIVNAAYGLTPDDVALMWRTAPPRMPLAPSADEAHAPIGE